jgi:hypothetical protein
MLDVSEEEIRPCGSSTITTSSSGSGYFEEGKLGANEKALCCALRGDQDHHRSSKKFLEKKCPGLS